MTPMEHIRMSEWLLSKAEQLSNEGRDNLALVELHKALAHASIAHAMVAGDSRGSVADEVR